MVGVSRIAKAALVAAVWTPQAAAGSDRVSCDLAATEIVRAAAVVDGDTVETISGETLRLAGIEAAKTWGFAPPFGDTARERMTEWVAGRDLKVAVLGLGPDRYGRRHVQAFTVDGDWLQASLVDAGLARVRPLEGEESCLGALLAAEEAARAARRGAWADADHGVRNADEPSLSKRNGLYEIVEGRVLSVGHGRTMIFLDFGRVYRRDFTIMVPGRLAERFGEAGVDLDALAGQRVRVRGVVEESGGPAIRISHPIALEVLDDD